MKKTTECRFAIALECDCARCDEADRKLRDERGLGSKASFFRNQIRLLEDLVAKETK